MSQKELHPQHESLFYTKLEIPNLASRIVRRSRLTTQLSKPGDRKITLLIAPAGYGKTTLLGEWLTTASAPDNRISWITLDLFDNSPFRFWSYIIAAINKTAPQLKFNTEDLLHNGYNPQDFTTLSSFINEIGQFAFYINLVLDDFHNISNEFILNSLSFLFEHQPRNLHIIIASRTKPALPLAKLRTQGRIDELTTQDLSFSKEETGKYLSNLVNVKTTPEYVSVLHYITQGWVAGLQLAAISLANKYPNHASLLSELTNHTEFPDYFSEEVLSHQDSETQDFLLCTSVLNEFSAPLCNELMDKENSQQIIDTLLENNLFIVPIDKKQTWYRYHPLFANALSQQLLKRFPEKTPSLHKKALDWLLENGYSDKAVTHALSTGQLDKAAELIDSFAMEAINNVNLQNLIHWINAIPDYLLDLRPRLGIYNAIAYFQLGQYDLVEPNLSRTEKNLSLKPINAASDLEISTSQWEIAAIRAAMECLHGNRSKGLSLGEYLINVNNTGNSYIFGMLLHTMGITYFYSGQLNKAYETIGKSLELGMANQYKYGFLDSSCTLAKIQKKLGHLDEANHKYRQALSYATDSNLDATSTIQVYIGLLSIALEQNDFPTADILAHEVISIYENYSTNELSWINNANSYLVMADYFILKNNLSEAQNYFNLAVSWDPEVFKPDFLFSYDFISTHIRILRTEARSKNKTQWHQKNDDLINVSAFTALPGKFILTRLLLDQGRNKEAQELLTSIYDQISESESVTEKIEFFILLSLSEYANDQKSAAFLHLSEALNFSSSERFTRIYIEEGRLIEQLLKDFYNSVEIEQFPSQRDEVLRLLTAMSQKNETLSPADNSESLSAVTSIFPLQEPLSERENDILHILLQEKSGKEIAEELMISINTTKTHIKNIYRKFGVHSRKMLIDRANELGIKKI